MWRPKRTREEEPAAAEEDEVAATAAAAAAAAAAARRSSRGALSLGAQRTKGGGVRSSRVVVMIIQIKAALMKFLPISGIKVDPVPKELRRRRWWGRV